jgi:hypothetical protein
MISSRSNLRTLYMVNQIALALFFLLLSSRADDSIIALFLCVVAACQLILLYRIRRVVRRRWRRMLWSLLAPIATAQFSLTTLMVFIVLLNIAIGVTVMNWGTLWGWIGVYFCVFWCGLAAAALFAGYWSRQDRQRGSHE